MTLAWLIAAVAYLAVLLVLGAVLGVSDKEISDLDEIRERNDR